MTDVDGNVVRELLDNAHRERGAFDEFALGACPALEHGVLTWPDRCNCGVKEAHAALDRLLTETPERET